MCKYCWHPEGKVFPHSVIIKGIPHNPGCPVIEGNLKDWEKGSEWGWLNSTASRREYPKGKTLAYYMGVRSGQNEMEGSVQNAAENEYYGVHQKEY